MLIQKLIEQYFNSDPVLMDSSYETLDSRSVIDTYIAIQQFLLKNFESGERIGLCLERDYRYFLCLLACMDVGLVFIPLRKEWPESRIEQIKKISGFTFLMNDEKFRETIREYQYQSSPIMPIPNLDPEAPLYILFTSGTTGSPKGVLIQRRAYENFLEWIDVTFNKIGPMDRVLNSTDFTFDVSLAEVAITLTRKACFVSSNFRDDLFVLLRELNDLRITVLATVPNNLVVLLDEQLMTRVDLSPLRYALIAGSRFPVSLLEQFKRFLPMTRVYNCYGPTEATIYCLWRELLTSDPDCIDGKTVSVGVPLPNMVAKIVDAYDKPLAAMEEGELIVGGQQLMEEYVGAEGNTDVVMTWVNGERFYKTGDFAFYDPQGNYYVTGRKDDTIKVSGQRVNLSDIEAYILPIKFVSDCSVIAVEHRLRGYDLVLYIVPKYELTELMVKERLETLLPAHQIPRIIRFCESLPVNNSGKTCKKTLLELYLNDRERLS
jgi:D-alanine--poly(phosphoribitol) ligase subunit 1